MRTVRSKVLFGQRHGKLEKITSETKSRMQELTVMDYSRVA